jgi:hypothetical protein
VPQLHCTDSPDQESICEGRALLRMEFDEFFDAMTRVLHRGVNHRDFFFELC